MATKTRADWHEAANHIKIDGRAFINGKAVDALSGETRPNVSPGDGRDLGPVAYCGTEDADLAIGIARKTFESGVWSRMAPSDRKMIMLRWAGLIKKHEEELALLECLDVGKPIDNTLNIDVFAAIRTTSWSGEAIDKWYDEIPPTPADTLALVQRLPLGVVAAIVPWNFPLSTTAWKLAPAIATGNSVILKPATNTPLLQARVHVCAYASVRRSWNRVRGCAFMCMR